MVRPLSRLIAGLLMLAPCAAFAQAAAQPAAAQVVSTAPPTTPPPVKPSGEVSSVIDAADADSVVDDGPVRDNRVHGEFSVGAGTNGYRQISGVATAPIGDDGQATIAVGSEQYDYRRR